MKSRSVHGWHLVKSSLLDNNMRNHTEHVSPFTILSKLSVGGTPLELQDSAGPGGWLGVLSM